MEIIECKSIIPYMLTAFPIGSGNTARCYKLKDGSVLKLFKRDVTINEEKFREKVFKLSKIKTETYLCPEKILYRKGKLIGYFYAPYINAPVLADISLNTKLSEIFKNYKKLYTDTKTLSNNYFKIGDVHSNNILFDGSFHIIDLDKGHFDEKFSAADLLHYNLNDILRTIVRTVYRTDYGEDVFLDDFMFQSYANILRKDKYENIDILLNRIRERCNDSDPTLKKIKKYIPGYNRIIDYHRGTIEDVKKIW